jgi:ABC-type lipoprotein export system ATPase subunit
MFQDYRLFPELTAVENVMLKSQLTNCCSESEVREMLSRLGLAGHIDRPCATLSLGQQQRVAFVRALAQPCDFILLDEPISHLDEENAVEMSRMLRERQQKDGLGVIVTSIGYRLPYDYDVIFNL